jgi:hypothetical protein
MASRVARILAAALCTASVAATSPASAFASQHLLEVLTGSNVNRLVAGHPRLRGFFNHRRVYPLGNPAADQIQARGVPRARPTLIYQSYARFAADVAGGRIDRRIQAVAYDPEHWSLTPVGEQQAPVTYMRRFANLARAHGFRVLLAPARDLMVVGRARCHTGAGERLDHAYLRCRIPAAAAADANIVEVQSQADEFQLRRFRRLLERTAAQARAVNPSVRILAGISTHPPTGAAHLETMVRAAQAAEKRVDGLWVNVFSDHPAQRRLGGRFFRWLQLHRH